MCVYIYLYECICMCINIPSSLPLKPKFPPSVTLNLHLLKYLYEKSMFFFFF